MSAPRRIHAYTRPSAAEMLSLAAICMQLACLGQPAQPEVEVSQPPAPEATAVSTVLVASAPTEALNPLLEMQPTSGPQRFDAVVSERVQAGGYTYLRLTLPDDSERWLATMGEGQPSGVRVSVQSYGQRNNFHSRRTGRTFEHLLFGEAKPQA